MPTTGASPRAGRRACGGARGERGTEARASSADSLLRGELGLETELVCAICLELMWKPVTLVECGHSFCCLCMLRDTRRRLQVTQVLCCPVCRTEVASAPSGVSVTIENVIRKCMGARPAAEAAAAKIKTDAMDLELFQLLGQQGLSRRALWEGLGHAGAVFDAEDQVFRCPLCVWELDRAGVCTNRRCGRKWKIDASAIPSSPSDAYNSGTSESSGMDEDEGVMSDSD